MDTVTTRLPDEDEAVLSEIEDETGVDRSEALRRLIRRGLDDWRTETAFEQLRDHSVPIRKAAEIANPSNVEMLSLSSSKGP